jgi:arylsulfatase A-like enzyme
MTRKKTMLVLALVMGLAGVLIFTRSPIFGTTDGIEAPLCPSCNVILILIDTLRADHLPCYGYERNTAPNICKLAEEGFLFQNMFANSPSTKTSVASLFTSMLASQHKSIHNENVLSDAVTTIAEILAGHGYHTYAVNGNPVIKSIYNYNQGFESWTDAFVDQKNSAGATAAMMNRAVFQSLGSYQAPFFLYLHYMDPHSPYWNRGKYSRFFNEDYDGAVTGAPPYDVSYFESRPDELEQLIAFYDNDIRFVDHSIGELFDQLREAGLYQDSVIILLSDHGEMFLEHGYIEHSNGVYTEVIDVPLIIRPPNHEKKLVETPVQIIDILPTLLSMLRIEVDHRFTGRPIFSLTGSDGTRPIVSEQLRLRRRPKSPEVALIMGNYKLIKQLKTNAYSLFNMSEDPTEHENVIDSAPNGAVLIEKMDSLLQMYASMYDGIEAKKITLDEESTEQLKALGYIH